MTDVCDTGSVLSCTQHNARKIMYTIMCTVVFSLYAMTSVYFRPCRMCISISPPWEYSTLHTIYLVALILYRYSHSWILYFADTTLSHFVLYSNRVLDAWSRDLVKIPTGLIFFHFSLVSCMGLFSPSFTNHIYRFTFVGYFCRL